MKKPGALKLRAFWYRGRRIRTLINGFGDRHPTLGRYPYAFLNAYLVYCNLLELSRFFLFFLKKNKNGRKVCLPAAFYLPLKVCQLAGKFLAELMELRVLTVHCYQYRKRCKA